MRNLLAIYIAMQTRMQSMLKDDKGATMVEYAMMVALIAVVCLVAVTTLGTTVRDRFLAIVAGL